MCSKRTLLFHQAATINIPLLSSLGLRVVRDDHLRILHFVNIFLICTTWMQISLHAYHKQEILNANSIHRYPLIDFTVEKTVSVSVQTGSCLEWITKIFSSYDALVFLDALVRRVPLGVESFLTLSSPSPHRMGRQVSHSTPL